MPDLAIIIPAYKIDFFDKTLQSLVSQTCRDFNVYVGDDFSPNDLEAVVNKYTQSLNIFYTRFDNNIGSKNLVHQWERCIALSQHEKWIWLFSDDDVAEAGCVENFYNTVDKNKDRFDVYRFNTIVIDEKGAMVRKLPEGPFEETSEAMAYNLLMDRRGNAMQDHIFSRAIHHEKGGLVFTEYAQGADWATSILFSSGKGIAIIPGAKVYWRLSSSNVSGSTLLQKNKMFDGHLQFLSWTLQHFQYLKSSPGSVTFQMIKEGLRFNLVNVIVHHYHGLTFENLKKTVRFMKEQLQLPMSKLLFDLRIIFVATTAVGTRYAKITSWIKGIIKR